MTQEAIKRLWRARTRGEATIALDEMDCLLDEQWGSISAIEFNTIISLIKIKGRISPDQSWRDNL
jgi:hypothetical protein